MQSYSVVAAVLACSLFIFAAQAIDSEDNAADCDCGPNSKGCKIENGQKVCDCEVRYRQENGLCKGFCQDDYRCGNGGKCVNEKCECLPGTSGEFCRTVDACEGIKGPIMCGDPEKVLCQYNVDTQKPHCLCRLFDYIYYPKIRDCVECDCGELGWCTLIDGKKHCRCNDLAAVRKFRYWGENVERCDECDCGLNADSCSFDGYDKVCQCKYGYAQQPDLYGDKCNPCDCGPNGQCYFKGWYKICNCDAGYKPFLSNNRTELTCQACDCGINGVCSFKDEVKTCECYPGYAESNGICIETDA